MLRLQAQPLAHGCLMQDKWKATTALNSEHALKVGKLTCIAPSIACVAIMTSVGFAQAEDTYPPQFSWFIGAEGSIVTPHFQSDILGADRNVAPNSATQILSFDWEADGAYRGWFGLSTENGLAFSLSHATLNQSTSFSQEVGGGDLRVEFDPGVDAVNIGVDGALIAHTSLDMHVTDLEASRDFDLGSLNLRLGAGLRYGAFERQYRASETGGTETIHFDHDFSGFGPSIHYEVEVPVGHGFSVYNGGRAALLFGEHSSLYGDEADPLEGVSSNTAFVTTLDIETGIQWRGQLHPGYGEWTFRAGLDAQAWLNGGGWDLFETNFGAEFPQHAGNFGAFGLVASAQYRFGHMDAAAADQCGVFNISCASDMPQVAAAGWFFGVEGGFARPHFERDVIAADESAGAPQSLEIFSFDWDADGTYQGWVGYQTGSGIGVSLSHAILNQSTVFTITGDNEVETHFHSGDNEVDIDLNNSTLTARNSLDLQTTDLEVWQQTRSGGATIRLGAGARFATFERSLFASNSADAERIYFNHEFTGFGPSLNYEVEMPVGHGFSLYNGGRAALLFGEHSSYFGDEGSANPEGFNTNMSLIPTLDVETGIQWRGQTSHTSGEWTLRAGIDAQAWINAGGWDLYDDSGGGTFPQQAGSFGTIGLVASAQYSFGSTPDHLAAQCGLFIACDDDANDIVTEGWFFGAEGGIVSPHFENDIVGADESFGPTFQLQVLSFDWDADGAYRGWLGYQTGSGFGVSLSHAALNQSTLFSQAEGSGDLRVEFDPDEDPVDIAVDGTLLAENSLELHATDLEFWQTFALGGLDLQFGAGVRYASFDRQFNAWETAGAGERVHFEHSFSGLGPSLNYEVEVPVSHGFSFYNGGRAAILFGEHSAYYTDERPTGPEGSLTNMSLVTSLDMETGLQWRGQIGNVPGEWTLRAGLDGQAWINGGGWDMYDDGAGATFPQHAGSFGTYGAVVSAQVLF